MSRQSVHVQARRTRHKLDQLQRKGDWRKVAIELKRAREAGVPLAEPAQIAALRTFAEERRYKDALQLLQDAETHKEHVSATSYALAMAACNAAERPNKALGLWRDVTGKAGLKLNEQLVAQAIKAFALSNRGTDALQLFDSMLTEYDVQPDVESYTAKAQAYGALGDWQSAVQLLEDMRAMEPPLKPSSETYAAVVAGNVILPFLHSHVSSVNCSWCFVASETSRCATKQRMVLPCNITSSLIW